MLKETGLAAKRKLGLLGWAARAPTSKDTREALEPCKQAISLHHLYGGEGLQYQIEVIAVLE